MTMRDLAGSTRSHLSASLHAVSMSELQRAMQNTASSSATAPQIALRGSLNATADATWGKTMQDLVARTDASLQASALPVQGGTAAPIDGKIHARYSGKNSQLAFEPSYIRTTATSVTVSGSVGDRAALQIRADSNDLHELETIASAFHSPDTEPIGIYGRATLNATVSGSTRSPEVAGQLNAENLKVRGSEWKLLRASIAASPSQIRIENGELDSANRGRVTFRLATALQHWSFTQSSPFQVQLAASQLNLAELTRTLGSTTAAAGTLSADVTASGTQQNLNGHGRISLTSAHIAGETIQAADLQFQGTGRQVDAKLTIDSPSGSANASLQYEPESQSYSAELRAPGIKLDQLETVKARNLQLQGTLSINASGRGTLHDPQLQSVIEVPQLNVRDQVIRGLKLQTDIANHVANFKLDSDVINTHAGGHGSIQLNGDYYADAVLDTQTSPSRL